MAELLSAEEFTSQLADYWCLDIREGDIERPLEDVGIDSLGKLELIMMLEDFAGHPMPDDVWSDVMTLRDIYSSYEVYASRDRVAADFFSPS